MRLAVCGLAVALAASAAAAQPGRAGDRLTAAAAAATGDDWPTVVSLLAPIVDDPALPRGDRAEANRLLGLAALASNDAALAETRFLAYLKLDLDGRLDPNLHPPEVIAFFENVRSKHGATLRALRPRPRTSWWWNLLPPAGQFQNRDTAKGWTLAIVGGTALAANVGSYALLRSWCDDDGTCAHSGTARVMRQVNLGAAVVAAAFYAYGVWDGFRHQRRDRSISVAAIATDDLSGLAITGAF